MVLQTVMKSRSTLYFNGVPQSDAEPTPEHELNLSTWIAFKRMETIFCLMGIHILVCNYTPSKPSRHI